MEFEDTHICQIINWIKDGNEQESYGKACFYAANYLTHKNELSEKLYYGDAQGIRFHSSECLRAYAALNSILQGVKYA